MQVQRHNVLWDKRNYQFKISFVLRNVNLLQHVELSTICHNVGFSDLHDKELPSPHFCVLHDKY